MTQETSPLMGQDLCGGDTQVLRAVTQGVLAGLVTTTSNKTPTANN